jgi:hypothetical protein
MINNNNYCIINNNKENNVIYDMETYRKWNIVNSYALKFDLFIIIGIPFVWLYYIISLL